MLKITDKPKYEDYNNTIELMEMFRHAIHSDFALEWIEGAVAHIQTLRSVNKALNRAIEVWFKERDEEKKEFTKLVDKMERLTFALDALKLITEKESDAND